MVKTLATLLLGLAALTALAQAPRQATQALPTPSEDAVLERRVLVLSNELRCLVCQNQTIADSNAGLAVDLRQQVREMMQQGRSDDEIIDYRVARYGDFVRYRPPFKASTLLLWLSPLLLLGLGGYALWRRLSGGAAQAPEVLDSAARERAARLLDSEKKS